MTISKEITEVRMQTDSRKVAARPDFEKWMLGVDAKAITASLPSKGLTFHAPLNEGQGRKISASVSGKATELSAAADPAWSAGQIGDKAFQRKMGSVIEVPGAGDFENSSDQ